MNKILHSFFLIAFLFSSASLFAAPFLPGTGQEVKGRDQRTGQAVDLIDDFEDPNWEYLPNSPKSSSEEDHNQRPPTGYSRNNKVFESLKRGHMDIVQRVEPPAGGLPNSKGALKMQTRDSGVPGAPSSGFKQDDLMMGETVVPIAKRPSVIVHLYIPSFESFRGIKQVFGIRTAVMNANPPQPPPRRKGRGRQEEPPSPDPMYYPSYFIENFPDKNFSAVRIRSTEEGKDVFIGPQFQEAGWWTFGLSFDEESTVHYYIRKGVGPFEERDRVASHRPSGLRGTNFHRLFFSMSNPDDGKSWTAPWIVDDPKVYQNP